MVNRHPLSNDAPSHDDARAVDELLAAAEAFSRAWDSGAACVRARAAALAEAARGESARRESLHARAALALARHEQDFARWQAAAADRGARHRRRECAMAGVEAREDAILERSGDAGERPRRRWGDRLSARRDGLRHVLRDRPAAA
jgi:hypothetical protein